tara:strand:+ start:2858 stop:3091 length:234 start_codon:yes stop_codon:yes gene_type:complete
MSSNNLKAMITQIYGSQKAMSVELGVTPQTVTNWMRQDPTPLLKYSAEIAGTGKVSYKELVMIVQEHKNYCIQHYHA